MIKIRSLSFYRGCVDPSEELMIRREVRKIVKKASELSDKILIPLSVVAQVTIHVCCFVLGKLLLSLKRFRCFNILCWSLSNRSSVQSVAAIARLKPKSHINDLRVKCNPKVSLSWRWTMENEEFLATLSNHPRQNFRNQRCTLLNSHLTSAGCLIKQNIYRYCVSHWCLDNNDMFHMLPLPHTYAH